MRQCDIIRHRGPDDTGVLIDGDFGFGMRRLSIQDIAGGHQPMTTPDGRYAIVFNGEIYNHREIRASLIAAGWVFESRCDTETILAGFAAHGNALWPQLEGMFAVAIWDRHLRRLTLARDPLGIKPLYLSEQHGGLAFASELKALRSLPGHAFDVDDRAVHDLFSFGHVRRPRSIFRQVGMLEPGGFLEIDPAGPRRTTTYWRPRLRPGGPRSIDDWTEQTREMLVETTARHMLADVPVAAFLSGGVDSSAILAAMTRATERPIKAFTIGHPGAAIDETAAAAEIAAHLGAEHVVLPLEMGDATGVFRQVMGCYDEPFADPAAIPTWYASKLAARHVKVVLCGEGGDEVFAGYKRHRNALAIERYRALGRPLASIGRLIERLPAARSRRLATLRHHAGRFSDLMALPDGYTQFFAATQTGRRASRRRLYTPGFAAGTAAIDDPAALEAEYFPAGVPSSESALERFLLAELTLNLPSAMLTRLDRASMAHSLEARVPLLSHRLVDWAMTIPTDLKHRGGTGKLILRRAVAPWLPPSVTRRSKQGFQVPHAQWLRGRFGRFGQELWHGSGAAAAGYLDVPAVDTMFDEHRRGVADHARLLYTICAFAAWWDGARRATAA